MLEKLRMSIYIAPKFTRPNGGIEFLANLHYACELFLFGCFITLMYSSANIIFFISHYPREHTLGPLGGIKTNENVWKKNLKMTIYTIKIKNHQQ